MATSTDLSQRASSRRGGRRSKLLLATVLGIMSAALVFVYLQGQSTPVSASPAAVTTVPVLTAARGIAANELIQPDMVVLKQVASDAVIAGALRTSEEVTGTVARFPMEAGEQITPLKVTGEGPGAGLAAVVPAGMRAMAIVASAVVTAGGILQPGDRVDVIAVVEVALDQSSPGTRVGTAISTMLVEDAEVLAVGHRLVELVPEALSTGGSGSAERLTAPTEGEAPADATAATVTLALTIDEAEMVLVHEQQGLIRLLVRPSLTTAGSR